MKRVTVSVFLFAALLGASAYADDGGRRGNNNNNGNNGQNNGNNGNNGQNNQSFFSSSVIGSTPGVTVGGVASGGAPWVVGQGSASLSPGGSIEVQVSGLLIGPGGPPSLVGTVGPVQMVAASLVCGGSGGLVGASTSAVFINASGNAHIEDTITVPASCLAPVVLVRIFNPAGAPGSQLGAFIASTGVAAGSNAGNNNHDGNDN